MVAFAWFGILALSPQQPVPASAPRPAGGELVLLGPADPLAATGLRLGGGGIASGAECGPAAEPGKGRTASGLSVEARPEGVLVAFASGRKLLFAPDGWLHEPEGAHAGPFAPGASLHFADGSVLRIERTGSRKIPIREVVLEEAGRAERLWWRGRPVAEPVKSRGAVGAGLLCAGEGDSVYRCIGLGPLLVLARVLAPKNDGLPQIRLALLTAPMRASLLDLARTLDEEGSAPAPLAAQVRELALRLEGILDPAAPLPRVSAAELRYALPGGFDLLIRAEREGVLVGLHRADDKDPVVEWILGYGAEVRLAEGNPAAKNQRGVRPIRLPSPLTDYDARAGPLEVPLARALLERLVRP
ncbi:MAG: hypothetical protein Fur0037_26780 [Planctomycetota bacterium]